MFQIANLYCIDCIPKLSYQTQLLPTRSKFAGVSEIKYVSEVTRRMTTTVDKALVYSRTTLHQAYRSIEENSAIIQNHAKDRFEIELRKYQKELDEIHKKAVAKGQDVSQCLKYKEEFKNIPKVLDDEMKIYFNDILNHSRRVVDETISDVQRVTTGLPNMKQGLQSCAQEAHTVNCVERTIVRVINRRVKQIKKDVGAAAIELSVSNVKLHKCLKEQTNKVGKLAADKIGEFVKCIQLSKKSSKK